MLRATFFRGLARLAGPALLVGGCGGGGGGGGVFDGPPGSELAKPGGGTYFLDPHAAGRASRIHLLECVWGRLVDVHPLEAGGTVQPLPAFEDMLVNETVQSDGVDYRLETNALTQRTRLVILRVRGAPDAGTGTFEELLARARSGLAPIIAKPDDGSVGGPFSLVARNACLSLRFDDLLSDGLEQRLALPEHVRIVTGYPPSQPFVARALFDPNHGGVTGDAFHSTRVLLDFTVTEEEAARAEQPLEVNSLGLPASTVADPRPNVSVRIATRTDPGTGFFTVLSNLAGAPMDRRDNGPLDSGSPTEDVVRAMRAGRAEDGNNGFLLDLGRPELIGTWPASVLFAAFDPAGLEGFDLRIDLGFSGVCRRAPRPADVVQAGEVFLEVVVAGPAPDADGIVHELPVRRIGSEPLASASQVLGGASYLSTYAGGVPIPNACWAALVPVPGLPPDRELDVDSQFVLRFSEPMDPASLDPFESLRLVRGNSGTPISTSSLVVSDVTASSDLRAANLRPLLPLSRGATGEYHLELLSGLSDLAGNSIASLPSALEYELDPDQVSPENSGIVLRFESTDELEPNGIPDLRGQVFYDFARGTVHGRSPVFESFPADRTQPVPSIMIPFAPGVQTPLSSFGSKLQYVWRYCDLGWTVEDESKHNLDVIGINWTPVGGTVLNDFFELFEMRLAHSRRQPDEFRTFTGVTNPCSGLGAGTNICQPCLQNVPYEDNVLRDPASPQEVVHERSLGYRLDSRDLYVGQSGVPLMPYPMNRAGAPETSFTWRDTAVLTKDGTDSGGIPLEIEVFAPLNLVPGPPGRIAIGGKVPAWGLPLLVEVRCFPSSTALGLNPLEIYLAQNAQALPMFRAFTTGGVNETGQAVRINPDLALFPEGGYNPTSRPPGKPTLFQADNSFYTGELDTVIRLSRAHTIWIPVNIPGARFLPPVLSPRPDEQPGAARIELEFRAADGFTGAGTSEAFDARELDPLGDIGEFDVQFQDGDRTWKGSLGTLEGASYVQMRITFVNDPEAGVTPDLSAVGVAYSAP